MTGLESAVSLSTVSCFVACLVFAEQLQLEALGRLLEHARRALALLQDGLDGRRRADRDLDVRGQEDRQLVDHRQVGRIGHDDHERVPLPVRRHEPVSQHEVGRDRPEEIVVEVVVRRGRRTRAGSVRPAVRQAPSRPPAPRRSLRARRRRARSRRRRSRSTQVYRSYRLADSSRVARDYRSAFDKLKSGM